MRVDRTPEGLFFEMFARGGKVDDERAITVEVTVVTAEPAFQAEGFPTAMDESQG